LDWKTAAWEYLPIKRERNNRPSTEIQRPWLEKGEAGSSDIPKLSPASLALEATTMFTRKQYERWSEEDDRALRTMSEAGKSLTLITVKLNRPMASIKARAADLHITLPGTEIGHRRKRKQSAWGFCAVMSSNLLELAGETTSTQVLYGSGRPPADFFNCLRCVCGRSKSERSRA
jgi:hypothetical protein